VNHFADLHIHTFYSDGSDAPASVVEEACHAGLSVIAITDHDTMAGVREAQEAAVQWGIEVISGIELSTEVNGKDIHILGYFLDLDNPLLIQKLQDFRSTRILRIASMIENLKKQGVNNITLEEVQESAKTDALGRPHLAAALIQKKWAANTGEVFAKFIGEQCPAYVAKHKQSPLEAISLIRQAGGVAVLAHPMVTNRDELIGSFVEAGLGGLEVYYPNCPDAAVQYYEGLARKHKLVTTGGSDAHGKHKNNTWVGKRRIPCEFVEQLRARAKNQ
jgi:predicted metal-dependent phosphoesterase TrpH